MSANEAFDDSYGTTLIEIDINKIFGKYRAALSDQRWKMGEQILNWGKALHSEIDENMDRQMRLLDQEYENQQECLEKKRLEFMDEACISKKRKNDEQIRQLLTQCNALKFELAAFQYTMRTIPYLILTIQEHSGDEQSLSTPKSSRNIDIIHSAHVTESSPTHVTFTKTKEKNRRSLITEFPKERRQSMIYLGDSIQECPICNMVFPWNMALDDQSAHVNEHFPND